MKSSSLVALAARSLLLSAATALVASCGGGGSSGSSGAPTPVTSRDAVRLADQATFGPSEGLITTIKAQGIAPWLASQMALSTSRYTSGGDGSLHQFTKQGATFCDDKPDPDLCWRDYQSTQPLLWDFYRNAVNQPDQLRQRVAFALQQIVVVNSLDVQGTYGFRIYYNDLLDNALGNYRQVLKKVTVSPVMGAFLNNGNNDKAAPNENYARELLQLFSHRHLRPQTVTAPSKEASAPTPTATTPCAPMPTRSRVGPSLSVVPSGGAVSPKLISTAPITAAT